MDIKNRKVKMFRCHIDPMMGARPKNAFMVKDYPGSECELTPVGVWFRLNVVQPQQKACMKEYLVPYANIQSIELELEEKKPAQ